MLMILSLGGEKTYFYLKKKSLYGIHLPSLLLKTKSF